MKKILLIAASAIWLTGCDDRFQLSKPLASKNMLSIAEMAATGKEDISSECRKGEISFNCEFLSLDLAGSGKWHYTKLYLYENGKAGMVFDGKAYNLDDIDINVSAVQETTLFSMKESEGGRGKIKIVRSNEGKLLNFDAYGSDNKHLAMGSVKLN